MTAPIRVFKARAIRTMNPSRPFATHVAVRDGRILAVGSEADCAAWGEIAVASGCFDQAHLNREFRQLAGEPPEAFLRSEHALSEHLTGLAKGDDEDEAVSSST